MWQVQKEKYKLNLLLQMSRVKMKDVTCVYCNKELKIGETFYCSSICRNICLKCLGSK